MAASGVRVGSPGQWAIVVCMHNHTASSDQFAFKWWVLAVCFALPGSSALPHHSCAAAAKQWQAQHHRCCEHAKLHQLVQDFI